MINQQTHRVRKLVARPWVQALFVAAGTVLGHFLGTR